MIDNHPARAEHLRTTPSEDRPCETNRTPEIIGEPGDDDSPPPIVCAQNRTGQATTTLAANLPHPSCV